MEASLLDKMTDFLKFEKPDIDKGSMAFENLEAISRNKYEVTKYHISNGFKPLTIWHNERTGLLTVEGSIPFFWQGHNFNFSHIQLIEAIDFISETLCTDLRESEVKGYEFGIVIPVELPPSYILQNHLALPGHGYNPYGTKRSELAGINFPSPIEILKMYDVGKRFRQLKFTKAFKESISGFDPKANYVRVEKHVLRPDKNLQIRTLSLKVYCSDTIQEMLKTDLIETYQAVQKKGTYKLPEGYKPKGNELLLLMLANQLPDVRQAFDSQLKSLGLDTGTVKNRQAFIRNLLKKLEFIADERIDLMPYLEEVPFR